MLYNFILFELMIIEGSLFNTSIKKDTDFFVEENFPSFSNDIRDNRQSANSITSMEIKCSGYGYFPQYQERAKRNLKQYLQQCLAQTPNLLTFKLTFNGFDIEDEDGYLVTILNFLKEWLNNRRCNIKTVWVHTNNLTSCSTDDFRAMINLIAVVGRQTNREQLSIQMSNWRLLNRITFKEMIGTLQEEVTFSLKFRVLRLEISSWFLDIEDAFHFIKSSLSENQILEKLDYKKQSKEQSKLFIKSIQDQTYGQFKKNSQIADKIKKQTGRNITTQFTYYNIKHFHQTLTNLVKDMLGILDYIEDFTIDFRNWNPILKLQDIRSKLQSKVGARKEFSFCQKRKFQPDNEDNQLRTTYLL